MGWCHHSASLPSVGCVWCCCHPANLPSNWTLSGVGVCALVPVITCSVLHGLHGSQQPGHTPRPNSFLPPLTNTPLTQIVPPFTNIHRHIIPFFTNVPRHAIYTGKNPLSNRPPPQIHHTPILIFFLEGGGGGGYQRSPLPF